MAILIGWLGWPVFVDSYVRDEVSTNAGGLIIWPARLLVPVGFFLLAVQGISELIKRIGFLMGMVPDPLEKHVRKDARGATRRGHPAGARRGSAGRGNRRPGARSPTGDKR